MKEELFTAGGRVSFVTGESGEQYPTFVAQTDGYDPNGPGDVLIFDSKMGYATITQPGQVVLVEGEHEAHKSFTPASGGIGDAIIS